MGEHDAVAQKVAFIAASACSAVVYADTLRREQPARAAEATELADLFCRQARRRVEALFDSLFDNDDVDAYALAQGVIGGRFGWLEEGVVDPAD